MSGLTPQEHPNAEKRDDPVCRPLAGQAIATIIEHSLAVSVDAHLLRVAERDEADRRNGTYKKRVRTTNAIERRFREVRRRTRPMGVFQDRTSMDRILLAVFTRENKSQNVGSLLLLINRLTLLHGIGFRSGAWWSHVAAQRARWPRPGSAWTRGRALLAVSQLAPSGQHADRIRVEEMVSTPSVAPAIGEPQFVSTGHLPSHAEVSALVAEAHAQFRSNTEGQTSQVYPALARVPSDLFGICVVGTRGNVFAVGDTDYEFSIMSVSKPFVFALVCEHLGPQQLLAKIGANATGLPFNSLAAVEGSADGRTNPMVNAGAIATTSLVPGETGEAKWKFIHDGLSRFAGRRLALNDEVYASATETNFRNRSIAWLLETRNTIYCDPLEATDLYTKQCSLNVSARDLAVMGATLADGGVNPITRERVVDASVCHYALAVMTTAGLYETSGDWLYDIGLPGKSGIGGGIVTVSPGKGGLGTFAPPLDGAGNSVKGILVARYLSQRLGMDLFASKPAS